MAKRNTILSCRRRFYFDTVTTKLQMMTISRVNCKSNQSESIVHCQLGHRRRSVSSHTF